LVEAQHLLRGYSRGLLLEPNVLELKVVLEVCRAPRKLNVEVMASKPSEGRDALLHSLCDYAVQAVSGNDYNFLLGPWLRPQGLQQPPHLPQQLSLQELYRSELMTAASFEFHPSCRSSSASGWAL
jgi:hypothetical protein